MQRGSKAGAKCREKFPIGRRIADLLFVCSIGGRHVKAKLADSSACPAIVTQRRSLPPSVTKWSEESRAARGANVPAVAPFSRES